MATLHILPNKTANITKTKPKSVSLSCKLPLQNCKYHNFIHKF